MGSSPLHFPNDDKRSSIGLWPSKNCSKLIQYAKDELEALSEGFDALLGSPF
jgi:hypothetical protein